MEAVDESVRLVQFAPQGGPVSAVVRGTADGSARAAQLRRLEFVRDLSDVFTQFPKKCPRLRCTRVVAHSWIVSSFRNVRATGSQIVHIGCSNFDVACRNGRPRVAADGKTVDYSRPTANAAAWSTMPFTEYRACAMEGPPPVVPSQIVSPSAHNWVVFPAYAGPITIGGAP